jgi:hypothetical protein
MFGLIILKKMATLKELEEHYSTKDAFVFLEIIEVNNANEDEAIKRARKD